jgi:predicted RNase H-like HicB family nuclease
MATVYYPAIVERSSEGYGVFFPDLPGCTSAGATLQDAALNAEEALAGHLLVTLEHGEALPEPSNLDAVEHDPEVDEVARILVRGERPGKSVRLNITMDEGLVAAIDRAAPNRSGFIAEAARAALQSGWATASGVRMTGVYATQGEAISAAREQAGSAADSRLMGSGVSRRGAPDKKTAA